MIIDQLVNQNWAPTNPGGLVTLASFPTRVPTTRPPDDLGTVALGVAAARDGVIEFGGKGEMCPGNLVLIALGTGAAGGVLGLSVYGWTPTAGLAPSLKPLWVPNLLNITTCTLGASNGTDDSDVPSNRLFASGMTVTYGYGTATTAGGQVVAVLTVPSLGYRFLEVTFQTGANATAAGALYRKV